jgi:UDP-N-acetyl-D-glucosamine dehydrogenase
MSMTLDTAAPSVDSLTPAETLRQKLKSREWVAAVYGLGYVGLQLAVTIAARRITVIGYDISAERVASLQAGQSHIEDVSPERLGAYIRGGQLRFTADPADAREADVIFVAVPTPLDAHGRADTSYIEAAVRSAAKVARPGQLISLESTTYPGTTRELVAKILAESGLVLGRDLFLVYSPERINPGDRTFDTATIPKLVGGVDEISTELGLLAYSAFVGRVHRVSGPDVAEMSKLFENIFRAVNIALVNEMAMLCGDLGIDIWDVVEAAETKPFGFLAHYPGPGVGGHCIPIDPVYLQQRALAAGSGHTSLMDLAIAVNASMPAYVVQRLALALEQQGKSLEGSRILIVGVAYKANTSDTRESPARSIIEQLRAKGAVVSYHDPLVPALREIGLESVPLDVDLLRSMDAAVLVTDHSSLDLATIANSSSYVLDTRCAMRRAGIFARHIETI